jgi:transposase
MKNAKSGLDVNSLFTVALGLVNPWEVAELHLDAEKKRLDIKVDFAPGSTFACPECGAACKVHDASSQTWRHLNFFEYLTYVEARQPRTKCDKHGVLKIDVPWARAGANFTLLFEALVVELARNGLTVAAVGRIVGEHDTRVWRVTARWRASRDVVSTSRRVSRRGGIADHEARRMGQTRSSVEA